MIATLLLALQCADGSPPPCRAARAATVPAPNSVAVLYFENASRDSNDQYLAEGLTEEVIVRLSGIERLSVTSRHLVRRYRGAAMEDPAAVGRALNVSYLVTGSIRRAGDRLRVTAELVNARNGTQVWGRQFDQAAGDVFAVQEALAEGVAGGIVGRLVPSEQRALSTRPTGNASAYDAWLRGNFFMARRDSQSLHRALGAFEAALDADPSFTDAIARLAVVYGIAAGNNHGLGVSIDSCIALSVHFANEAVRRAPRSAESWLALRLARGAADPRGLRGVREAAERAVALDSNNAEAHHALGVVLAWLGERGLGESTTRRALALEPARPVSIGNLGVAAAVEGRHAERLFWADSALVVDPDYPVAHSHRLVALLALGRRAEAGQELARWSSIPALRGLSTFIEPALRLSPTDTAPIAANRARLMESFRPLPNVIAVTVAEVLLLAVGDGEGALSMLQRSQPRGAQLRVFLRSPVFDPIRSDPRFARIIAESMP